MTLSILDQKNGKHWTRTSGSTLLIQAASVCNLMITVDLTFMVITGLWVCGHSWGWSNFIGLKKLKDLSGGYVVGSRCLVKADLAIVGSSNDC